MQVIVINIFSFVDDQLYAVLLPISVFLFVYMRRRDVYDLHHSVLGKFCSRGLLYTLMTDYVEELVNILLLMYFLVT